MKNLLTIYKGQELSTLSQDQLDQLSIVDIHSILLVEDPEKIPVIIKKLSQEKLLALVDLSSWNKDRFDVVNFTTWLKVILAMQPFEALQQIKRLDQPELALFLTSVVELSWFNVEQNYDGNPFITPDRTFVIYPREDDNNDGESEIYRVAVDVINLSYLESTQYGRSLCLDAMKSIKATDEEDCYRVKNARLADEGIPSYIDALELFHYEDPTKLLKRIIKMVGDKSCKKSPPISEYIISEFAVVPKSYWDSFDVSPELLDSIQVELSALLTASVVMNNTATAGEKYIREVIERSKNYFDLGMELIKDNTSVRFNELLQYVQLRHIFRLGFSLVVDLRKNANNLKIAIEAMKRPDVVTPDEEEFIKKLTLPIPLFQKTLLDKAIPFENLVQLKEARKMLSELAGKVIKTN